jgi:hypothetical protein
MDLIVVTAIGVIALGLLLGAVQKVRQSAHRAGAVNQLRQISVGLHQSISAANGKLPTIRGTFRYRTQSEPLFHQLHGLSQSPPNGFVPLYQSLTDPSRTFDPPPPRGVSSFAANVEVFEQSLRAEAVADGMSNTVALCERYARCGNIDVEWGFMMHHCFDGRTNLRIPCVSMTIQGSRRATFADPSWGDVRPVLRAGGTDGSVPGKTFQILPAPDECDTTVVQASSHGGLMAAMLDGSVRTVGGSVSSSVFWSAVTPSGGEAVAPP